jgi:hypothetical protein
MENYNLCWGKLYSIIHSNFNICSSEEEWKLKLKSIGIVEELERPLNPNRTFFVVGNPAGGWLQIEFEIAIKLLVLGLP